MNLMFFRDSNRSIPPIDLKSLGIDFGSKGKDRAALNPETGGDMEPPKPPVEVTAAAPAPERPKPSDTPEANL